jgi:hypothetical protein
MCTTWVPGKRSAGPSTKAVDLRLWQEARPNACDNMPESATLSDDRLLHVKALLLATVDSVNPMAATRREKIRGTIKAWFENDCDAMIERGALTRIVMPECYPHRYMDRPDPFVDRLKGFYDDWSKSTRNRVWTRARNQMLRSRLDPGGKELSERLVDHLELTMRNKSMFTCIPSRGKTELYVMLGLGPPDVGEGDKLHALAGATPPYILRSAIGADGACCTVLGECYVLDVNAWRGPPGWRVG